MRRKYSFILIFLLMALVVTEGCALSQKANSRQTQQPQQENQLKQLEQDLSNFKSNFYDKTMQNVNLALQGANRATTLVSVFAITFTILSFILGFWGIKELSSIRKVRLDAEKNLKLTKHFSLGYAYIQASLLSESLREFLEVVKLDENNDVGHTQLGFLYMSVPKPDLEKSKLHSKRATKTNPKNYIAYLNLGVAMSQKGDKQEDILSVYLDGGKVAIEQEADDITIGKIKLFTGHCYKNLNSKPEAKVQYDEARPYFLKYKNSPIKELSNIANRWLAELEESYRIVSA